MPLHSLEAHSATHLNDVRVDKAWDPLVFAHNAGVLVVGAVTVAPAARLAVLDALLAAAAHHIVQPDFPWTGSRASAGGQLFIQSRSTPAPLLRFRPATFYWFGPATFSCTGPATLYWPGPATQLSSAVSDQLFCLGLDQLPFPG